MNRFLLIYCSILAAAAAGKLCGEWKKVGSGNTCYSIRTASGLSEELFVQLNPTTNCDTLQVGQKLCVSETEKLFCYEPVTVSSGDTCWSIRTAHQLDEREFMEMNEGVNCDQLAISHKLCVRAGVDQVVVTSTVTPTAPEPAFECPETVGVVSGDTCHGLAERYGLNTTQFDVLNEGVNCDSLQIGSSVCVSREGCQLRYETQQGDSCHRIAVAFKISVEELKEENAVDCDRLQIGRRLCVWRTSSAAVSNLTCSTASRVKAGDTCWSLSIAHGISVDDLRLLNPRIDCDLLQIDSEICVQADSIKPCTLFRAIDNKDSCEQIAAVEEIPFDYFISLNPTLNCDRMNLSDQVCIGRGPYEASKCLSSVRVTDPAETCTTLLPKLRISQQQLLSFNPRINCSSTIPQFSMICSSATQTEDRLTVVERLFKALGATSRILLEAFNQYKSRPSQPNNGRVYSALLKEILRPEVSRILEELAYASNDMRMFMDSGLRTKTDVCGQLRGSDISSATINCFCDSSRLNVYCHALLYRELDDTNEQEDERSSRDKRALCSASLSVPSLNVDDYFTDKNAKLGQCFGADCSVQMGFVEISLAADVCMPFITVNDDKLKFCLSSSECSQGDLSSGAFVSRLIADGTSSASLSLCLLGSTFIRRAAKIASKDAKVKSTGVCLTVAKAEYSPLAGKLDLSAELNLLVFDVKGGAVLKAHDLPVSEICDIEDLECNDYCLWKFYNTENWKAYGYIEVRLFKIFDFFEGIKIAEEKFNAPRKAGCNPNKEVAILWADERTCEGDSVVVARCMSGSDKAEFEPVGREYNGLTFRPNVWGSTLFFIEFVDANSEKIGFDVYGGKSKNRASKGNFYYAVRNDGIYYGTNPKEVNQLKASWKQPCQPKNEDGNNGNGGDGDADEPTGTSSLPAASCGKRIVGYYTGWGKREVSVDQLRKLTHAIFAFIATSADGSVDFGVVSEDDSSPDAAALARQRFFDLKTKARRASAGVRVLFAVGGWDNSQHFSAIAADEGKRRRFVDSCADFLKNTGVDGVDVDWEYPVTGGAHEGVPADKENYVRLLRELRERLDRLQRESGRKERYLISLASAAGEWTIRPGYDLKGILEYADFINVMTYDYYGAWGSKWGAYTGPPSPLYYGQPKGFSGKMNADFTMKFYACRSKKPSQLNMGVPFYGRYWENVGGAINSTDEMWRTADAVGGKYQGGYVAWRDVGSSWDLSSARLHDKSRAPYIWNAGARKFLGFENQESLREKAKYAIEKNLGGLMIWAIDQDDEADSLLSVVSSANLCEKGSGDNVAHTCSPIDDVRWWNPENSDESKQGRCGKYAPLIDGFYPVCDPDDPGYSCCGKHGFCGSGEEFCECEECVDYRNDPSLITKEPTKPTRPITWHMEEGQSGRCGKEAAQINGQAATCNPDSFQPCCGNGFYCGSGKEFCECDGCVDYRNR